jgi:hypothetical protein
MAAHGEKQMAIDKWAFRRVEWYQVVSGRRTRSNDAASLLPGRVEERRNIGVWHLDAIVQS